MSRAWRKGNLFICCCNSVDEDVAFSGEFGIGETREAARDALMAHLMTIGIDGIDELELTYIHLEKWVKPK